MYAFAYTYTQVHAPECPVIIVGTHRDLVSNLKEEYIDQDVRQKYSDTSYYPTITNVCCISNTDGSIKTLRKKIYTTAAHLYIDGKQKCQFYLGTTVGI